MTKLKRIQKFGQQIANAMAAVLQVEVAMVDDTLCLIAATGYYKDKIGMIFGENCLSHQVLISGRTFVVPNAREHEACSRCPQRFTCPDVAEICLPIVVQGTVIGTFAIIAFDMQQKEKLLNNENRLIEFVARVSDLIGSAIEAEDLNDNLASLANEFQAVVNSVHNGIIAVNSDGVIKQVNDFAADMLGLRKEKILGMKLREIFNDPDVDRAVQANGIMNSQEIFALIKGKKLYFLGNLTPLNENKGHVLVIRSISEVKKIVGSYLMKGRKFTFDIIVGESNLIKEKIETAKKVARSDSTILIQGESGTGKELFARAIHTASSRAEGPLVAVNCAAIPESLLESELFGYEEGAFTDAKSGGKLGRFELANKGTLFLDEIGDMPLHLQAKILRVLQEKEIDRLGGDRPVEADVRIIAATNKNLEEMVKRGEFRHDLYYRLNVIPLNIPPLRERKEDIIIFLQYFRERFNKLLNKTISGYSDQASEKLLSYHWPGNVRELENTIEYAVNIEQERQIQISSIPWRVLESPDSVVAKGDEGIISLAEAERQLIVKALKRFGTSTRGKERAAQTLNIGIATLYRKIKQYGL